MVWIYSEHFTCNTSCGTQHILKKKYIEAINNQTNKWGCFGTIKKSPDDGKEAISRKSPGLT